MDLCDPMKSAGYELTSDPKLTIPTVCAPVRSVYHHSGATQPLGCPRVPNETACGPSNWTLKPRPGLLDVVPVFHPVVVVQVPAAEGDMAALRVPHKLSQTNSWVDAPVLLYLVYG